MCFPTKKQNQLNSPKMISVCLLIGQLYIRYCDEHFGMFGKLCVPNVMCHLIFLLWIFFYYNNKMLWDDVWVRVCCSFQKSLFFATNAYCDSHDGNVVMTVIDIPMWGYCTSRTAPTCVCIQNWWELCVCAPIFWQRKRMLFRTIQH